MHENYLIELLESVTVELSLMGKKFDVLEGMFRLMPPKR
jgi:hypothetical protein